MSKLNHPESPATSGEAVNVTPGFEEKLHLFWDNNRKGLLALCVIVLVAIVAQGGWDYWTAQQELEVQKNYAAMSSPEKLKSFAETNAGHTLAGVACLQVADAAYAAGKGTEAVSAYQSALKIISSGSVADRASLGLAMAQLLAGQKSEGEAGLQRLVDGTSVSSGVRVEAAYQLVSLVYSAGQADKVKALTDQILKIDPASPWAQRAMSLQMADTPTASPAAVTAPAPETPAAADPVIKLNLGK
ncbi:MAG: tetratricopeptide repeat protein [Cephaloticoccus sp.]|nr:tetratricopeptide repeat protein [Cephaloticoccus sp.]